MFLRCILDKKIIPYIYLFFLSCFSHGIFSQNFELHIKTKDTIQKTILNEISYKRNHRLEKEVYEEINKVHERLKKIGFLTSTIDTIKVTKSLYIAFLNPGLKTDEIIIISPQKKQAKGFKIDVDSIRLNPVEFEKFTQSLLTKQDQKGNSFSEISYKNPRYKNNTLILELYIAESSRRNIDTVIIKGYKKFPQSFIKNFFQIKDRTTFSKTKIEEISTLTKKLSFVNETKKPQVLFKKDSTHLYLFFNKLESNSFDGIVNFASKEDSNGLLLNGNLDLKLNNVLNSGEQFELFWNKVAEEKTEFNIHIRAPYLLKSALTTEIGFNIFRQDSTFLNTTFNFKTEYALNNTSKLSFLFSSEKSTYLLNLDVSNLDSFSNYFAGIEYNSTILSKNNLFKDKFKFNIKSTIGKRKSATDNVTQFKWNLSSLINLKTSERSYVYIKNESGVLTSNKYLTNELFRIGGANSIRGFNEQSIFTNQYSYLNVEYRYLTSLTSYVYSITDLGLFNDVLTSKLNKPIGFGIGYGFKLNNNHINFAYANGFNSGNTTKLKNSKVIIKWTSFF